MLPIHSHQELRESIRSDYPNYDDPMLSSVFLLDNTSYYDGDSFTYDSSLSEPMLVSLPLGLAIQLGYKGAYQHQSDTKRFRIYPYDKADGVDAERLLFESNDWHEIASFVQKRGICRHLDTSKLDSRTLEDFRQAPKSFEDGKAVGVLTIGDLSCALSKEYLEGKLALALHFFVPAKGDTEIQRATYAKQDILKAYPACEIEAPLAFTHEEMLSIPSEKLMDAILERVATKITSSERYMELAVWKPMQCLDTNYFAFFDALMKPMKYQLDLNDNLFPLLKKAGKAVAEGTYTGDLQDGWIVEGMLNRVTFRFYVSLFEPGGCQFQMVSMRDGGDGNLYQLNEVIHTFTAEYLQNFPDEDFADYLKKRMLEGLLLLVKLSYLPLAALDADSTDSLAFDWHDLNKVKFMALQKAYHSKDPIPEEECGSISYRGCRYIPMRTPELDALILQKRTPKPEMFLSQEIDVNKKDNYTTEELPDHFAIEAITAISYPSFQSMMELAIQDADPTSRPEDLSMTEEAWTEEKDQAEDTLSQEDSSAIRPGDFIQLEDDLPYICLFVTKDGQADLYHPVTQSYRMVDVTQLEEKRVPDAYPNLKPDIKRFIDIRRESYRMQEELNALEAKIEAFNQRIDTLSIEQNEIAKRMHEKAAFSLSEEEVMEALHTSSLYVLLEAMDADISFHHQKLPYLLICKTRTLLSVHPDKSVFALLLKDGEDGDVIDTDSDMYQDTVDSLIQSQPSILRPSDASLFLADGKLYFGRTYTIILPQFLPDKEALITYFNQLTGVKETKK